MCKLLKISRSNYYTYHQRKIVEDPLTQDIVRIFHDNKKVYGTRRIKAVLQNQGNRVSRRRIGRIMRHEGLVSVYTIAQYKVATSGSNESQVANVINREFNERERLEAIISDLTYIRVGHKWNYVCTIMDLHNREIIGYSVGANKNAQLVYRAFSSIRVNLSLISLFHSDRGKEFINQEIERLLSTFNIKRSLSHKGNPYDNAVAESNFKSLKFEFVYQHKFDNLEQLQRELRGHIWWYNNVRLYSSLGYKTPVEYSSTL